MHVHIYTVSKAMRSLALHLLLCWPLFFLDVTSLLFFCIFIYFFLAKEIAIFFFAICFHSSTSRLSNSPLTCIAIFKFFFQHIFFYLSVACRTCFFPFVIVVVRLQVCRCYYLCIYSYFKFSEDVMFYTLKYMCVYCGVSTFRYNFCVLYKCEFFFFVIF